MKVLAWHVGLKTQFSRSVGKAGRHLQRCLDPELWKALENTYSDAGYESTWEALAVMCALFRAVALEVAAGFAFTYPHEDDQRVSAYLAHIRSLPRNAERIY